MRHILLLAGALLALNTPASTQQWTDNFDAYTTGTLLDNVGGWFGWDNVPAAAGTADGTFARSVPNSLLCGPGADAVHPAFGVTSGKWSMTAWQYIPTGGLAGGPVYFILNSVYNHGGPYTWTTQLQCTPAGTVIDDLRTHTAQPVVFDQWVPFRTDIDIGANTVSYYYNGALISEGVYATGTGPVELQNVDLYSAGGTCYWDDICLEQAWTDNFDSYTNGQLLDNVGGWFGWDNTPAAAGTAINAFAHSAPNSLACAPGADAVHPDLGITCGKWTMTAWQFIPNGGLTAGPVYLILNNEYTHGGPYTWTTQLQCTTAGTVVDDLRTNTPQPVLFGQWVKYRLDIDLDANTVANYYNGALISQGVYATAGPVELQNIDLYSAGGTCFWDDIVLEPTPLPLASVYGTGCPGTGGLVPAISATGLPVSGSSFSVDLSQAVANQPATLLFGFASASLPVGSCTVLVTLPAITVANVLTSPTGTGSVPLNIPADLDLGSQAFMQWVVLDPNGAYLNAVTLSDALSIQIGK